MGTESEGVAQYDIEPLDSRVVVEPIDLAPDKIGSLYIPEAARTDKKSNMMFARVVACGPDVTKVKPGDLIVVNKYAADFFQINGERDKQVVLSDKDVWVRLKLRPAAAA